MSCKHRSEKSQYSAESSLHWQHIIRKHPKSKSYSKDHNNAIKVDERVAKCKFQPIFPYLQTIYGFLLIVKKIFSSDFPQKIILDYQMFTLVLHWKIIVKGRNPLNNALTVLYFLTFILKHPVRRTLGDPVSLLSSFL